MINYQYWKWSKALPKEFCKIIVKKTAWKNKQIAQIGLGEKTELNKEKRITEIVWQDFMSPIGCICQSYIHSANVQAGWNFNIETMEPVQIGKYVDGGHYDWHIDTGKPQKEIQRKLSISILLNDPSEFDGGEFEFKNNDDGNILTAQGDIVVFPSFLKHRVTPVTSGVRYSAVTWYSGKSFR